MVRAQHTDDYVQGLSFEIDQGELLDACSDGIAKLDRAWRVVYVNGKGRELLGEGMDPVGRNHWECFPQMVYPGSPWVKNYEAAMNEGRATEFESFFGKPLNVWLGIRAMPAADGIIVYFRDITVQKRTEDERNRSVNHLQQVLQVTTDAIAYIDQEWRVTYLNERAREMTAAIGEVLGKNVFEVFPRLEEKEGELYLEHYRRAMNEGTAATFTAFYPEPLNVWVECNVQRAMEGIVVFFRDITFERETDEALLRNEKLAAVGRLASSIAHEINNPLEAVTNLLYLIRGDQTISQAGLDYVATAERELSRVSHIASQTLRFHRNSSNPTLVDPGGLTEEVLEIYGTRLGGGEIEVLRDFAESVRATCIEGDIRQVLNNLIGNAFAALGNGGRLTIRTRCRTRWSTGEPGASVTVADDGTGMSREVLAKAFEAFFSTKGIHGTGLGLWISKRIVHKHRGYLQVKSSQGPGRHGTVFRLWLPLKLADAARGAWQLGADVSGVG